MSKSELMASLQLLFQGDFQGWALSMLEPMQVLVPGSGSIPLDCLGYFRLAEETNLFMCA